MQDPEALGGLTHSGGVDYHEQESDGAFIAPENLNVASANQYVLKSGGTFIVNDPLGDITGVDDGLFVNDTRVLSQLRLTFGGRAPSLLSGSVSSDNTAFTAHLDQSPVAAARRRQHAGRRDSRPARARAVRYGAQRGHRADQLRHKRCSRAAVHFVC